MPRLRRFAAVLGVALAVLAAGAVGAAPGDTKAHSPAGAAAPTSLSSAPPTSAQIRQAAEAVLSQGKYRRRPNQVEQWLRKWLEAAGRAFVEWLDRLGASKAMAKGTNAVFYALVGGVVLGALVILVRFLLGRRRGPPRGQPAPKSQGSRRVASPGDLQSQAAALAARGEYGPALRLLQQASLLALDRRSLLAVRRSATNGEYLRQLRAHPEPRALLGELLALVEVYQYGGQALEEGQYRRGEAAAAALLREGKGA